MSATYDAVVVGAGPAGSQTARLLSQRGHRVLVLEEHGEVGAPVHCSGFVTPRTLTEAGVSDGMVLNAIRGALIYGPGGRCLSLGGDRVRALVVDRKRLDQSVAAEAEAAGAEFRLKTRVLEVTRTESGVTVTAQSQGRAIRYQTRLAVGADGVRSRVARSLGEARPEMIWCAGADVRLPDHPRDLARVYVGTTLAPGWFGWSIPLESGRVRLGVGGVMRQGAPKPRHLLNELLRTYSDHFRRMEVLSFGGGFIPLYVKRKTYGERVLLVGDAALQVKPTSGGGIYMSLVAARHAAPVADQALRRDQLGTASLASYEKGWRREFGGELERGTDIRKAFLRLDDTGIGRLMAFFDQPFLRPIIERHGDIDFPTRMFSRTMVVAPLLGTIVGVPDMLPARWRRIRQPTHPGA